MRISPDDLKKGELVELVKGQLEQAIDIWTAVHKPKEDDGKDKKRDLDKVYDILTEFEGLLTEEPKKAMTVLALRQVIFNKIAETEPTLFMSLEIGPKVSIGQILQMMASRDGNTAAKHELPNLALPVLQEYLDYLDASLGNKAKEAAIPLLMALTGLIAGGIGIHFFENLKKNEPGFLILLFIIATVSLPGSYFSAKKAGNTLSLKSQEEVKQEIQQTEISDTAKKMTQLLRIIRICAEEVGIAQVVKSREPLNQVAIAEMALAIAKNVAKGGPAEIIVKDGEDEDDFEYKITADTLER